MKSSSSCNRYLSYHHPIDKAPTPSIPNTLLSHTPQGIETGDLCYHDGRCQPPEKILFLRGCCMHVRTRRTQQQEGERTKRRINNNCNNNNNNNTRRKGVREILFKERRLRNLETHQRGTERHAHEQRGPKPHPPRNHRWNPSPG